MQNSTVDLTTPITVGENEVKSLTLRKPAAGELRGIKMLDILQMDPAAHAVLVPRICEELVDASYFWKLDATDLMSVIGTVVSFFASPDMDSPRK